MNTRATYVYTCRCISAYIEYGPTCIDNSRHVHFLARIFTADRRDEIEKTSRRRGERANGKGKGSARGRGGGREEAEEGRNDRKIINGTYEAFGSTERSLLGTRVWLERRQRSAISIFRTDAPDVTEQLGNSEKGLACAI